MNQETQRWLGGLSDEYIINWCNKGLFRRAGKLVKSHPASDWDLDSLSSRLDGFSQSLTSPSLKGVQCDCPAMDLCHHVIALVLGLRQAAGKMQSDDVDGASDQQPWLIKSHAARIKAVGKPHYDRAVSLYNRGIRADISTDDHALIADVVLDEIFQVHMPRIGSADTWMCSCKQPRCVHRALVMHQACADAGMSMEDAEPALTEQTLEQIRHTRRWLTDMALHGINGLSRRHLDQGTALATELGQADLPRLAKAMESAGRALEQEWQRSSSEAPGQLRESVAALWAHTLSLASAPKATIASSIGGYHRELYTVVRGLRLHTLGVEIWETPSGYRGYSLHCFASQSGRSYAFSEARASAQDPSWDPRHALAAASLGDVRLTALEGCSFSLNGWASQSGRISAKEGTEVIDIAQTDAHIILELAPGLDERRAAFARALRTEPLGSYPDWGVLPLRTRYSRDGEKSRWIVRDNDHLGIEFPASQWGRKAERRFGQYADMADGVAGRLSLRGQDLSLAPVFVFHEGKCISLRTQR